MTRSVKEVAEFLGARVIGDSGVLLNSIAPVSSVAEGSLVFVEDEKNLALAQSSAAAIIAGEFAANARGRKPLIIAEQPRLAFARVAGLFREDENEKPGVHSSAVVSSSARLHPSVVVGAHTAISEDVQVGPESHIGAGCVIGRGVRIGRGCRLYPNVTVYPGVLIGDRVILHAGVVLGSDGFGYVRDKATGKHEKFPQVGRLEIEDDVEIGANSTVDRGALETTRIARGTKIDNLVHIGHNCQIGEDVIIAAQTGLSGSIVIEKNVVLGGQVGIGEHARIEEGVMLGGQGGVLPKKILRGKGVAFWGTPAAPLREYLKQLAVLARLAKKE